MSEWDRNAEKCGNCMFWPLSPFGQGEWDRKNNFPPSGIGGYATDGTVSDCRANPPMAMNGDRYPGKTAIWPQTERWDWCGQFKKRQEPK